MSLSEQSTYYDVLDINPDASPHEIREAYLRIKSAFNKDSVALYTLISTEEREDTIQKIEEAYQVLSSPDRRKEYDRCHGLLLFQDELHGELHRSPKVVSIDRVPPMESSSSGDALLVPPSTDFASDQEKQDELDDIFIIQKKPEPTAPKKTIDPTLQSTDSALAREIAQEVEWRGSLLRRIREAQKFSIEEMSTATRITKSYIIAIEDENFSKLPAAVYLRGFIIQIAKALKLKHDTVAAAYLARYYQYRSDQAR